VTGVLRYAAWWVKNGCCCVLTSISDLNADGLCLALLLTRYAAAATYPPLCCPGGWLEDRLGRPNRRIRVRFTSGVASLSTLPGFFGGLSSTSGVHGHVQSVQHTPQPCGAPSTRTPQAKHG
jgi:hypothetical protein